MALVADPQHLPAVVIALPAEIDMANADRVGQQLGAALAPGVATVIADMTATRFCDSSGINMLVRAHGQAAANGTELRLVVPSTAVLRTLALLGGLVAFRGDEQDWRAWLFTTARRRTIDERRRRSRRPVTPLAEVASDRLPVSADAAEVAIEHLATRSVMALVAGLPRLAG